MLRIYVKVPPAPVEVVVVDPVKYGLLYNWYAATDARLICAAGWEVPERSDFLALATYLGGTDIAGQKLKEAGNLYWGAINTGNNESKFNARGADGRSQIGDPWVALKRNAHFWCVEQSSTNSAYSWALQYDQTWFGEIAINKKAGYQIRPLKTTTTLTHGQTGIYTGNDGKVYRTICIGTQEWLADNLAETKYRNGDWIPGFNGGVYTPIANSAWAALTTGALCAYNDDWSNV